MSTLRLWGLCIGLTLLGLLVTGCGGGGSGLTPTSSAGNTGYVKIRIAWPTAGGARLIPADITSLELEVTGPGMETPVTGIITAPDTSIVLTVPAGPARQILATGKNSDGMFLIDGKASTDIAKDATSYVTLTLNSRYEPENNDPATAPAFTFDANEKIHIFDTFDLGGPVQDTTDVYKFPVQQGKTYEVSVELLEQQAVSNCSYYITANDDSGNNLFSRAQPDGDPNPFIGSFTALADGTCTIAFNTTSNYYGQFRVRYHAVISTGGNGNIDISVQ